MVWRAATHEVRVDAGHLDSYVGQEPAALVFTGTLGGVLRRGNFRRDTGWAAAATGTGVPGLHFHDLRHTGNTLAVTGRVASDASCEGIRRVA